MTEYLLRVKPSSSGGFAASIRQFAPSSHPEVRAVCGPVSHGRGETAPAAMLAAVIAARLPEFPAAALEGPYGH
jgi:hypothetical protein